MKHFTSYYANYNNIPKNYMCIGISRFCPEWFANNELDNFMFVKDNFLAPSEELLQNYKDGKISQDQYKREYVTGVMTKVVTVMGYADLGEWIKAADQHFSTTVRQWDAIVFMCYERPDEFCHRHILRKMLTNVYHVQCDEYGYKEKTQNNNNNSSVELFTE